MSDNFFYWQILFKYYNWKSNHSAIHSVFAHYILSKIALLMVPWRYRDVAHCVAIFTAALPCLPPLIHLINIPIFNRSARFIFNNSCLNFHYVYNMYIRYQQVDKFYLSRNLLLKYRSIILNFHFWIVAVIFCIYVYRKTQCQAKNDN